MDSIPSSAKKKNKEMSAINICCNYVDWQFALNATDLMANLRAERLTVVYLL